MASAQFQKYLEILRLSQLFEPAELDAQVAAFQAGEAAFGPTAESDDMPRFAQRLLEAGLLTPWQQNFLAAGKYKGMVLGKYCILKQIGAGGMGQVYLARHRHMQRQVAIKVLPEKLTKDGSYLERFHREARAIAAVDHPNLVRAFNVDNQGNLHYLVMEFVEGETLQDKVMREKVLDPDLAVDYVRQAALGLAHAHERGLIHRDIKPGNLLIDTQGTVKILDLGLAKVRRPGEKAVTVEHNDGILGTADYLAPEQAVNSTEIDARADLYSLGCTLYFMLVGHPPFDGGSVAERLLAHQKRTPPALLSLRGDLPLEVVELCERLMAKRPEQRFESAEHLVHEIDRMLNGEAPSAFDAPVTFRAPTTRRKGKSPVVLYAAIASTLAVCVGIAGAMMLAPEVKTAAVAQTEMNPRTKPSKPASNAFPNVFPVSVSATAEPAKPVERRKGRSFGSQDELEKLWQTPAATAGQPMAVAEAVPPVVVSLPGFQEDLKFEASGYKNATALKGWPLLFVLDIPNDPKFIDGVPYTIDNSALLKDQGKFKRVAYYLELQQEGQELQWVATVFDCPTQDVSRLGVPIQKAGTAFDQPCNNMSILTNVKGIATGGGKKGYQEFWPDTYGAQNVHNVKNASDTLFDWGDARGGGGLHGSMQVHHPDAKQVLFAFSGWGTGSCSIGIGNAPSGNPDWTFASNGPQFTRKSLQVFLKK